MKVLSSIILLIFFANLLSGCSLATALQPQPAYTPTPAPPCADGAARMKAFYDLNDAGQYTKNLPIFNDDATLTFYASGVNGHVMSYNQWVGKTQILSALSKSGLRRSSYEPNAPVFHETEAKWYGPKLIFMLLPDRKHPDGRPYNPYWIEATFSGCKLKTLLVIEKVTWL